MFVYVNSVSNKMVSTSTGMNLRHIQLSMSTWQLVGQGPKLYSIKDTCRSWFTCLLLLLTIPYAAERMHTLFFIVSVCLRVSSQSSPSPGVAAPSIGSPPAVWVGGIYEIHDPATDDYAGCSTTSMSDAGATLAEAHYYAVRWVNDNVLNGTGVTLKTYVIDTCNSAMIGLQRSTYFAKHEGICQTGIRDANQIYALLGGTTSDNANVVSTLMRAFCVPFVASLSTSTEFDDTTLYPYFLRCVPSDKQQALAIVHILQHFEWRTVNLVYETSLYGSGLAAAFKTYIEDAHICVENDLSVSLDNAQWDSVMESLNSSNVGITVAFFNPPLAEQYFTQLVSYGLDKKLQHIGADGWSTQIQLTETNKLAVVNSITTQQTGDAFDPFESYVRNLSLSEVAYRTENPNQWLGTIIANQNNCFYNESKHELPCNGSEKLLEISDGGVRRARQVFESVYVAGAALRKLLANQTLESFLSNVSGSEIVQTMQQVQLNEKFDQFYFRNNSGPTAYDIFQLQFNKSCPDGMCWVKIGTFKPQNVSTEKPGLSITGNVEKGCNWNLATNTVNQCRQKCKWSFYKKTTKKSQCCYLCTQCENPQYSFIEDNTCKPCDSGKVASENYSSCATNISDSFTFSSTSNVMFSIVNTLAAMGAVLCLAFGFIVHRHIHSPVFKATGGELNYVMVFTVIAVFMTVASTYTTPSVISCGLGWAVLSLAMTMCLGVAVLRLHIYREVCTSMPGSYVICERCFKDNHLRLHALLLVLGLQVLILVVWGILRPPVVGVQQMKNAVGYVRICASQFEAQTLVLFFVPALLLCIAFVYSYNLLNTVLYFFQREARMILRSCTCIALLGLVVVPLLVSNDNFDQEQKLVVFQLWCTLLGFSMMLTLVLPDTYLAVFKPNKNNVLYILARRPLSMEECNPVLERFWMYIKNFWALRNCAAQRDQTLIARF